jgi:hypothetical protein
MKHNNQNNPIDIKHADFVKQIALKEMMETHKNITNLREPVANLEMIFGDDTTDYMFTQK